MIKRILKHIFPYVKSYSQCGEDVIIYNYFFNILKKDKVVYLDIGANDPRFLSNTYYFYRKGMSGYLIEPNCNLCKKLKMFRRRDRVLNCGVGSKKAILKYYRFVANTLNTFSKKEAEDYKKRGYKPLRCKDIEVIPINDLMKKIGEKIDLLSIDVEGMDYEILKALDFSIFSPDVIVIESYDFDGEKDKEYSHMCDILYSHNYDILFDTGLNTIFVKKQKE